MFIEELDDFICEEASVSRDGIMNIFSVFYVLIAQEGNSFFDKSKAEKRFSAVKTEETVFC